VGVAKVWTADALWEAVHQAFAHAASVLIEEWIEGREATVGVLEQWGGKAVTALPEVEIVPPKGKDFFDYEAKYSGATEELCPGRFSRAEKEALAHVALTIHQQLGLRHFSRTDCIVHPKRGVFFLEVNTLPGLTAASLFPKAAHAVGIAFPALVSHLIQLAVEEGRGRRSIAEVVVV
jgi:D-alanine-D-alanine ligase